MRPFRLDRRALLRGAGAAVALPLLDAMLDGRGGVFAPRAAHAQSMPPAAPPPQRLITLAFSAGVFIDQWTPSTDGTDYTLTAPLAPLAPHRADFTLVSGLENTAASAGGWDFRESHSQGAATLFTGVPPLSYSSVGGPSVDQVAAMRLGTGTRFPSIAIGVQPAAGANGPTVENQSWRSPTAPVPARREPLLLYNDLFSVPAAPSAAEVTLRRRRSVLDLVSRDIARLSARVGASDRALLDEHLTSIRTVEQSLASVTSCAAPSAPAAGAPPNEQQPATGRLFMDLLVLALRCDLTRFGSFQLQTPPDERPMPWLGLSDGHHVISHRPDTAGDAIAQYTVWKMEQVAYLLAAMKAVREGTGTLLDNTLLVVTSEIGDLRAHNWTNLPVILAGRAGGRVRAGRHVRYPTHTPFNRLLVTMLRAIGVDTPRFGIDGTDSLSELLA